MPRTRRLFLRAAALTLPAMACTAIASAAERPGAETPPGGDVLGDIVKSGGRATCPLCMAGKPCLEHLV